MLPDRFPERVDPQRIFAKQGSISSKIPLGSFDRLLQYLRSDSGVVEVRLDFGFDESGRRRISGALSSRVCVRCERCLEDITLDLAADVDVLVVSNEAEARALPAGTEAIVPGEDGLDLRAMIEDELILSLPIVPYHEDTQCNEDLNRLQQSGQQETGDASPFAKLRELKLGKTDDKAAGDKNSGDKSSGDKTAKRAGKSADTTAPRDPTDKD